MNSFTIHAARPHADETTALLDWSGNRLDELERWAIRRQVSIPGPILAGIRRRYAEDDGGAPASVSPVWDRKPDSVPAGQVPEAALLSALERDLLMYAASLAEGGIDDLTVTTMTGIPAAFYAPESRRLFLPDWLVGTVSDRLFAPTALFPEPPSSTVSWLFFQSLVLTPPSVPSGPAAHVLGIRESD
ncbi:MULTISPECIES: hypothetical protein [Streptomyces]|uniref:Uncharacterized protein n=1 Tax=Streptomyces yunnanensis TaxID=156453 RepID=A0ABY7ZZ07_9ACTN|nr:MULTISPECIES: hypothetical protein [Streptomyces]AJC52652.1 hypothetical protein GZL_00044 [Streptomyces sp. 769]AJC61887.1 hypothetical protein GZL_09369 [Streptomyces sp. 769]WEB37898.1 hypothetical protein MOV08_00075 [Streptomyces yunnanensis]